MEVTLLTKEDVKKCVHDALSEAGISLKHFHNQKIYGIKGLADFLGVGLTTAWSLKNKGNIPYYKAGKKIFFIEGEVLEAIRRTS